MNEEEIEELLDDCLVHQGITFQFDMMIEECAELIQAINKLKRMRKDSCPHPSKLETPEFLREDWKQKYSLVYFALCSELADVKNMTRQLERMLDPEAIRMAQERKLDRLRPQIPYRNEEE